MAHVNAIKARLILIHFARNQFFRISIPTFVLIKDVDNCKYSERGGREEGREGGRGGKREKEKTTERDGEIDKAYYI